MSEYTGRSCDSSVDLTKISYLIRHDDIADALTGQGERLAVGVADQRIPVILRNIRHIIALEGNLAIRLIRDNEDGMAVFLFLGTQYIIQNIPPRWDCSEN